MGSGRNLKISATGFPGTNQTWRFIQQAWREPLEAFARLTGDKVIVSGAVITPGSPTTVSNGFISYQGEIIPFVGGNLQNNITLIKTVETVAYDVDIDEDGNQDILPAYESKHFQFGTGGEVTFPFTDLIRLKTIKELSQFQLPAGIVIDPNYFPFTQQLYSYINTLVTNHQADWNVTNPESEAYIKNKPTVARVVAFGSYTAGDVKSGNKDFLIPIPTMPNTNYMVHVSLECTSTNINHINDTATLVYTIHSKTTTSFKIYLNETGNHTQHLRIRYAIIANY